jgi:TRAP-type C4-dicarboxylate transport system permease small subunit
MTFLHGCKIAFPYVLTSTALLIVTVFSAVFMMSNKIKDLRTWLALALTGTFIVLCIGTFSLIIANGGGTMTFQADFLKWLGGATIAEVAGIVLIVFRFFFKATTDTAGTVEPKPKQEEQPKQQVQQQQ